MHLYGSKFKVYPGKFFSPPCALATQFLSPTFLGKVPKYILSIYGALAGNRWYSQINQFQEKGYL